MDKDIKVMNESKLTSDISIGSKIPQGAFTKNTNKGTKGNAPKPTDIKDMIKSISKKGGE